MRGRDRSYKRRWRSPPPGRPYFGPVSFRSRRALGRSRLLLTLLALALACGGCAGERPAVVQPFVHTAHVERSALPDRNVYAAIAPGRLARASRRAKERVYVPESTGNA